MTEETKTEYNLDGAALVVFLIIVGVGFVVVAAIFICTAYDWASPNPVKTITVDKMDGLIVLDTNCNVYLVQGYDVKIALEEHKTYTVEIEDFPSSSWLDRLIGGNGKISTIMKVISPPC